MNFNRRTLDVALLCSMLIGGAILVRGCPSENRPLETVKPKSPAAPATGRDLLALVDPARDAVQGDWKRDGTTLVTPIAPFARCRVPAPLPEEYDLRLQVGRAAGNDSFNLGFVIDGRQLVLVLDGWTQGELSGIEGAGGKPFFQNATTYGGRLLRPFFATHVALSVRRERVTVNVDGKDIIRWKPELDTLAPFPKWDVGDPPSLFLGSYESSFRIEKMDLIPARPAAEKR